MGQMDPKGDSLVVREVLEGGAAQKQGMLPGTDFVERMRYVFLRQCENASCEVHLLPVLETQNNFGLSLPRVMYISDTLYLLYACFGLLVFDCLLLVSYWVSCSFSALASSRSPVPFRSFDLPFVHAFHKKLCSQNI
jgi:hypothetical protein